MNVSPINAYTVAATGSTGDTADRVAQKTLDQKDFFQLLSVQLSSQDPLKPMADTEFISQLANFTALQNSVQLTDAFDNFSTQQGIAAAQNLLGRTVTIETGPDSEVSGVVSGVFNDGQNAYVTVDGISYDVRSVRQVELTPNPTDGA